MSERGGVSLKPPEIDRPDLINLVVGLPEKEVKGKENIIQEYEKRRLAALLSLLEARKPIKLTGSPDSIESVCADPQIADAKRLAEMSSWKGPIFGAELDPTRTLSELPDEKRRRFGRPISGMIFKQATFALCDNPDVVLSGWRPPPSGEYEVIIPAGVLAYDFVASGVNLPGVLEGTMYEMCHFYRVKVKGRFLERAALRTLRVWDERSGELLDKDKRELRQAVRDLRAQQVANLQVILPGSFGTSGRR